MQLQLDPDLEQMLQQLTEQNVQCTECGLLVPYMDLDAHVALHHVEEVCLQLQLLCALTCSQLGTCTEPV